MPLVYQQNINENTKVAVWHIIEDESFFLGRVQLQKEIRHPHKRLQHLAGRYLLCELFPGFPLKKIMISVTNKPYIEDDHFHFSISHCGDYAATIVSTVNRVGVDIEIPQPKILGLAQKFLNSHEVNVVSKIPLITERAITIAWSIKEAVYKWYGDGQVDFKRHIHIGDIDFHENKFTAPCTFIKDEAIQLTAKGKIVDGNCLVWICS